MAGLAATATRQQAERLVARFDLCPVGWYNHPMEFFERDRSSRSQLDDERRKLLEEKQIQVNVV